MQHLKVFTVCCHVYVYVMYKLMLFRLKKIPKDNSKCFFILLYMTLSFVVFLILNRTLSWSICCGLLSW